jgi:dihydrolipoamide dehydrogenase
VVIASGARPLIPPIEGLDSVPYLTNETVLELDTAPGSLVIIGGGYIAVEYAHLFAALGARVSLVEMLPRLMSSEEPEVSDLLYRQLSRRMKVYLNARAVSVKGGASRVSVTTEDAGGARRTLLAERLLVASGRRPNADLLEAENAGVTLDARGYVEVDRHLRTRTKHIYAVGDANGKAMFTHAANAQAYLMAERLLLGSRREFDLHTVPHAVFTRPQIASVGLTVAQAREQTKILVGRTGYRDIVGGEAIGEEEGFALAVVEKETRRILGFHIAGPQAPLLIQEVTNAMASGGGAGCIAAGMHIHPSLSELVDYTLNNLEEVNTGEGETALTESPARR